MSWSGKNDDLVSHTATSGAFDTGTIASGKTWRHTFTQDRRFFIRLQIPPTNERPDHRQINMNFW